MNGYSHDPALAVMGAPGCQSFITMRPGADCASCTC